MFGIVENGPDLAERVVLAETAFHRAKGGAADLADDGQDRSYLVFGYQFFYINFPGRNKGGEVAFDGACCKVAPCRYFADGDAFLVELETDAAGVAFFGAITFFGAGYCC